MEKNIFQKMTIKEQVSYINLRMEKGETLTDACKSVDMTKRISGKFKNYGYTLTDKQFIPSNKPTQTQEVATDIISTPKIKSVKKPIIGRPKRTTKTHKMTTEINLEVFKKLKHYCVDEDVDMREVVEMLLIKFLK